ncbi:unnamed protein product [Paramecium octaurelia]|uniref:Palmitoyltransferase n=1 Tax=Paramecium octaurelia TaxID=43137 RepID=A0A8S1S032_PAROT|nr:unnamed protein product [Paramecium octaurelia]
MNDIENGQIEDEDVPLSPNEVKQLKRKKGSQYCFWFRNDEPLITIGPHWPFPLFLTVVLILGTYYIGFIFYKSDILFRIVQSCSGLFLILTFLITALKNQGINYKSSNTAFTEHWCSICSMHKSKGTIHCKDCNICIRGYDHHCIWIGKCVGEGNQFAFNVFILAFLVFFLINYVLLLI